MAAVEACRTAVVGGHVEQCIDYGETRVAYNSCLMGRSSNGELAYQHQHSSVNCSALCLHNSAVLCLRRLVVGITWPVPAELDDAALEARLFSPPFAIHESPRPQPDWPRLHAELRRPGVTLLLLWEEYRAGQPEGYGYSRFCDLYRDWRAGISPTMRQTHVAGERLFVDFAGQTVPITDPLHRRGAVGTDLRRCTRRLELHLRRSTMVAGPGGLDWLPRQRSDIRRRRHTSDRLRQSQGRRHRREPLSGDQSHLPGDGRTLRHRHPCQRACAGRVTRMRLNSVFCVIGRFSEPAALCASYPPTDRDGHSSTCIRSRANLRRAGRGQASRSDRRTAARA